MEIEDWKVSQGDLMRIIQESVPGKQITMAHIIASPDEIIYKKLGLDPRVDYHRAAIGVLTLTPSETAIITADLAIKASAIQIGFIDRFSGERSSLREPFLMSILRLSGFWSIHRLNWVLLCAG